MNPFKIGTYETGYNTIKEDLGYHGCLWWSLFSLYKLFKSKFALLLTWQWWVYLIAGWFIAALLMIPWYFIIRRTSRVLVKADKVKYASFMRWVYYILSVGYILALGNWIFSKWMNGFPVK